MRTFIFSALVALFVTLPGGANATANAQPIYSVSANSTIDQNLREEIFKKLHASSGLCFNALCKLWDDGKLEIEKNPVGYVVSLNNASGTVIIGVIDDL